MIRKIGTLYFIYSSKGKKLSKGYKNKKDAENRLKEIEYLKNKGK